MRVRSPLPAPEKQTARSVFCVDDGWEKTHRKSSLPCKVLFQHDFGRKWKPTVDFFPVCFLPYINLPTEVVQRSSIPATGTRKADRKVCFFCIRQEKQIGLYLSVFADTILNHWIAWNVLKLDYQPELSCKSEKKNLIEAMHGHILAESSLTGVYKRGKTSR